MSIFDGVDVGDAERALGLACFECCGRGYVIVTHSVAGDALEWDDCPRCDGSGKEGLRG